MKVDPRVYSLLRSFVDSSRRTEYLHNKPYIVAEQEGVVVVKFRKKGKWLVTVSSPRVIVEGNGCRVEVHYSSKKVVINGREIEAPAQFIAEGKPVPISIYDVLDKAEHYLTLTIPDNLKVEYVDLTA